MATNLPTAARERELLATVADGIVTAAAGKELRAEVACPPAHPPFAGQHARGLPCRCLAPSPGSPPPEAPAPPPRASEPVVVVIISAATSLAEECRISIRIIENRREADPQPASSDGAGESYRDSGQALQVVVDYSQPNGPTIRHMSAQLATSTESAALTITKGGE